jgi:hypothetical protein
VNVKHVCETCAEDQNRYGCYCELESGDPIVTANIFTPCPAGKLNPNRIENYSCISLDIIDPCKNNSCQNGAACVREGLADYKCNCASGFGGKMCEMALPSKTMI